VQHARVGLFGGTFNPPHFGHVAALEAAARTGRFDRIVVTVAGDPYQKSGTGEVRPATQRLALARAAFSGLALVEVSDMELRRTGPSYTIDTVRALLTEADSVDVLIGADVVARIDSWREADALAELVTLGVFPRPGDVVRASAPWRWYEIDMAPVDLSSSFIRDGVVGDGPIEPFVPRAVIDLLATFAG
jgi:nicotinate-nucleotide adenylyltransferase